MGICYLIRSTFWMNLINIYEIQSTGFGNGEDDGRVDK